MPGFDGTGPRRFGPGRGLGPCGRGLRRGRNRFWNNLNFFRRSSYNQFDAGKNEFLREKTSSTKELKS